MTRNEGAPNPPTRRRGRKRVVVGIRQLAELARGYYLESLSKTALTDTPAARLGEKKLSAIQVARALALARENNVVAIDVDESYALTGTEVKEVGSKLRGAFRLREVQVFDISEHIKAMEQERAADKLPPCDPLEIDGLLHQALANATAKLVWSKIASEEHIAVAGGRAVYRFASWLRRQRPSAQGIMITPLSARLWVGNWQVDSSGVVEAPVDADDVALMLALAFQHDRSESGTRFSRFGFPIYAATPAEAKKILETYSPMRANGEFAPRSATINRIPTRAFAGVGVLAEDSGHRIARFLQQSSTPGTTRVATPIDSVRKEIEHVMALVRNSGLPHVGDISNRFFPVLPLPSELSKWTRTEQTKRRTAYQKLAAALHELNSRAIVCNWAHLRRIPLVRVIAGGHFKSAALWTILIADVVRRRMIGPNQEYRRVVGELTVDKETADTLLREHQTYTDDRNLQDWYDDLVLELKLFET